MSQKEQILRRIERLGELSDENLAEVEAVSQMQEPLSLLSLKKVSDLVAVALSEHRGRYLSLGVDFLSDEAARALGQYKGWLFLDSLESISVEVALGLAQHKGHLYLNGLKSLSEKAARALCAEQKKTSGRSLSLDGLSEISAEVASALAQYNGNISLRGLRSFSEEVVCALAQNGGAHLGSLLNGLERLGDEHFGLARAAAQNLHSLSLDNLKFISPKAASAFALLEGNLTLNGLTSLSEDVARSLCVGDGTVDRRQLRRRGTISFNGLEVLSDDVAQIFAEFGTWDFYLDRVTSLSNKAALHLLKGGVFFRLRGIPVDATGLEQAEELTDDDVSNVLLAAMGSANLELPRLRKISDIAAQALAFVDGGSRQEGLHLNGLRELSDNAFQALASVSGFLALRSLEAISPAQLRALHRWRKLNPELTRGTDLETLWRKFTERVRERGIIPDTEEDLALLDAATFFPDSLDIPELQEISHAAAKILFFYPEGLFLDGLKQLPDLSQVVSAGSDLRSKALPNGRILSLNGLREISESNLIELLKQKDGLLLLDGLKSLPESEATLLAISRYRGAISLDGITTLSLALAEALAKSEFSQSDRLDANDRVEFSISLNGVAQFEDGATDALSKYHGKISLGRSSDEK
jgi:hypothetical protein